MPKKNGNANAKTLAFLFERTLLYDNRAHVSLRVADYTESKIRNLSYHSLYPSDHGELDGLVLKAFENEQGQWLGGSVEYYDLYAVDIGRAEVMLKTLRQIRQHLDRLNTRFGHAENFGQFAIRVADALGIETIVKESKHNSGRYDDNDYVIGNIGDLAYWLDSAKTVEAE